MQINNDMLLSSFSVWMVEDHPELAKLPLVHDASKHSS